MRIDIGNMKENVINTKDTSIGVRFLFYLYLLQPDFSILYYTPLEWDFYDLKFEWLYNFLAQIPQELWWEKVMLM